MRVDGFCGETKWDDVKATAVAAEATGFDGFCAPEISSDPFITLSMAAAETSKIGVRTAIAVAFPRSPMMVANSAWSIQANSGGRFTLGLGTQVKGHNERRFSVPWVKPASRLIEYVESLHAIWRCWEKQERLHYQGEHYQFSLMTPEFSPKPNGLPRVPVYLAAVRPRMMTVAGKVGDGVRLHGFCTRKYLEQVALPNIEAGLAEAGRSRESFEICGGGFIATGPDQAAVDARLEWVRYRIAFYGSTRTYAPVMSLHGWDDLGAKLHVMSKEGRWKEMAAEIPDDVLHEFAVAGTYDEIAPKIEARFGGISDTVELPLERARNDALAEAIASIRKLDCKFAGQPTGWAQPTDERSVRV